MRDSLDSSGGVQDWFTVIESAAIDSALPPENEGTSNRWTLNLTNTVAKLSARVVTEITSFKKLTAPHTTVNGAMSTRTLQTRPLRGKNTDGALWTMGPSGFGQSLLTYPTANVLGNGNHQFMDLNT